MLGKLIKLETKASARFLLPTYLLLIVMSILNRITLSFHYREGLLLLIPTFFVFTYVISIVIVLITTFILMISRFYKNFLTDEGYLMFTLPVSTRDLILSKLIVTFCYSLISALTAVLSLFIVFINSERMSGVHQMIREIYDEIASLQTSIPLVILLIAVLIIIGILSGILNIYVSIALGQLYKKHKLLGSFIAYMAIYTAIQAVGLLTLGIGSLIQVNIRFSPASIFYIVITILIIVNTTLSFIYYGLTTHMFRKKLNID